MSEAEAEKMVQAFTLKASDPAFNETIRDWRLVGSPDGTAIGAAEELIESLGELAVPVMDQEPQVYPFLLSPHAYIPGLLLHPLIVRVEA